MEDIAKIGFSAETDDLARAKKALEDIEPAAKKAETASEKLEKKLNQMDGSAGNLMGRLKVLGATIAGVVSGVIVNRYVKFADTWSDLSARVGLAMGDIDKGAEGMARLSEMARRTYSPLENTAEMFTRNAKSLQELGYNTNQTFDFLEALNNSLVVSGARGDRAASLMNALSKAMAGGKLSGDELNTVIESGGRLAQLLAENLGVTTNQLRQMGADGNITSDVIYNSLVGSLQQLRIEAESMPATIGDAFTLLGNSMLTLIGTFDQTYQISATIATAIIAVSDSLQNLGQYTNIAVASLSAFGTVLAAVIIPSIYGSVTALAAQLGAFVLLNGGIWGAVAALFAFRGALVATGIGALAVLIGAVVYKIMELKDELGSMSEVFTFAGRVAQAVWEKISAGASWAIGVLKEQWILMQVDFATAVANMQTLWLGFLQTIAGTIFNVPGFEAIQSSIATSAIELEGRMSAAEVSTNRLRDSAVKAGNEAAAAFDKMLKPIDIAGIKNSSGMTYGTPLVGNAGGLLPGAGGVGGGVVPPPAAVGGSGGGGGAAEKQISDLERLTEAYNKLLEPMKQAETAFKALDEAKQMGVITADQYKVGLESIQAAFMAAGGSALQWSTIVGGAVEDVGKKISDLAENGIKSLSSEIASAVVDGKANFGDLAKSIVKSLIDITIQALILKPLMDYLGFSNGGAFGVGGSMGTVEPFAKGGAFTNSVVSTPTPFKFAQGGGFGLGVMGEAGPEAVMPLTRGPDGSLGVQMYSPGNSGNSGGGNMTVNVYNMAENTKAREESSTDGDGNEIRNIIVETVTEATADGEFDNVNQSRYGNQTKKVYR